MGMRPIGKVVAAFIAPDTSQWQGSTVNVTEDGTWWRWDGKKWDRDTGPLIELPMGEPGRIPELESTRAHADYWLRAARAETSPGSVLIHAEQAINAWKNAAYAAWDKIRENLR